GLSVQKAAAISAAFVEDGCARKAARQLASSSRQRDFWRWVKLPWKQYVVKLPLLAKGTKDRRVVEEDVAINLPSDFIHEMHRRLAFDVSIFGPGGEGSLTQYWQGEDEEWLERIGLQDTDFATTIPLFFHEDGVPSFKDESFSFWSWSALSELGSWQSRTCVVGLASSRVLPATRRRIAEVLAWDLHTLRQGHWDNVFSFFSALVLK
ncbi:unnamed protein product, partial [Symbiodinium pilosum]